MKRNYSAVSLFILFLAGCSGQVLESSLADSSRDAEGSFQATIEGLIHLNVPKGVGRHRENRGFYWITLEHDLGDRRIAIDFLRKGKERFEAGRYDLAVGTNGGPSIPTGVAANFYGNHEKYFEHPVRRGFLEITSASAERVEGQFEFTAVDDAFISYPLDEIPESQKVQVRGTFQAVAPER